VSIFDCHKENRLKVICVLAFTLLFGCVSRNDINVGMIKLHDDYLELNGKRYKTIDVLVNDAVNYKELYLNAHTCLNTSVLIEVMEKIKENREGVINVRRFGSHDDGTCY
jgi:hypothetical protein